MNNTENGNIQNGSPLKPGSYSVNHFSKKKPFFQNTDVHLNKIRTHFSKRHGTCLLSNSQFSINLKLDMQRNKLSLVWVFLFLVLLKQYPSTQYGYAAQYNTEMSHERSKQVQLLYCTAQCRLVYLLPFSVAILPSSGE